MAGVRIQNIPSSVTDKQLKVYFSNPKHGGGPIKQLLYPMPCNTAIVIYEDSKDAQTILAKRHKVGEEKLTIKTLPRQLYRGATVQVDKRVSKFVSRNPEVVDELQYVAELKVDFSYEREAYVMSGSWYQLEWALQYIDRILDAYEYDKELPEEEDNPLDTMESSRPLELQNPNIPSMPVDQAKSEQPFGGPQDRPPSYRSATGNRVPVDGSFDSINASKPAKKNKNMAPHKPGETGMSQSQAPPNFDPNLGSRMRKIDTSQEEVKRPKPRGDNLAGGWFGEDNGEELLANAFAASKSFMEKHQNLLGVDLSGQPGERGRKNVQFDPMTDFSQKPRPSAQHHHRKTRGIDVAQTDFGDVPMSYEITVSGGLVVRIAKDDITKQGTECIVNATSQDLGNTYGVSRAIVKAVGQRLQMDCINYVHEHGYLDITQVMHTAAGGNLDPQVKCILHTAGPSWSESRSEEVTHALVCTYVNCLQYADMKLKLRSIAMPLISAGAFGFPLDVCVQAFYDAILLLTSSDSQRQSLKEVRLICFDEDSTMAVIMILQSLQDCDVSQVTQVAIDRYKSNVSQNGVGANNFEMPFTIPQAKSEKARPARPTSPPHKQQGSPVDEEKPQYVKPDNNPDRDHKDKKPVNIKDEDKRDTDSEDEQDAKGTRPGVAETEEPASTPYEAYGEVADPEPEPELSDREVSDPEFEEDYKAAFGRDIRRKPRRTYEAVETTNFTVKGEEETDEADKSENENEEEPKVEAFKPNFQKKSKNAQPGFSSSLQSGQKDAEEGVEKMSSLSLRGEAVEAAASEVVSNHGQQDTDTEEEEDAGVKKEHSDEAHPDLTGEGTDDLVAQMSSILQKIQPGTYDNQDDTRDTVSDVNDTTYRSDDSDSDSGDRARAWAMEGRGAEDMPSFDSVGGSMVKVERADVEDDSD